MNKYSNIVLHVIIDTHLEHNLVSNVLIKVVNGVFFLITLRGILADKETTKEAVEDYRWDKKRGEKWM